VRIVRLRPAQGIAYDLSGALMFPSVAQRVTEQRRESDLQTRIVRVLLLRLAEAPFEDLDRALGRAKRRVRLTQRRVHVSLLTRCDRPPGKGVLQAFDCVQMVAAVRGREAKRDQRPARGQMIARGFRLRENRSQRSFRFSSVAVEANPKLRIRQPQLTLVGIAQIATRFEILDRHAQLRRQHPQCFHRRRARTRLDPRDIRVRDARRREVALRETALETQPLQPLADALHRRLLGARRHRRRILVRSSDISQIVNRRYLVTTWALPFPAAIGKEVAMPSTIKFGPWPWGE